MVSSIAIKYKSFYLIIIIVIKSKRLNSFIQLINGILTGTITLGQSGPGSNDNESVLHIPQNPRLEPLNAA